MREYRTIDKTEWGPGPWQDEPDKVQWQDEATGLPCLAVRVPDTGHWCGYVGVSGGHPLFHVSYQDYDRVDVRVHGGLTFSDACSHGPEDRAICHVPEPGQSDDVWWFGFDCAHHMDFGPGMTIHGVRNGDYRTLAYVKEQCASLAAQLNNLW